MNNLYILMEGELNAIEESDTNFKVAKAIKICQNYLEKLKKYVEDCPVPEQRNHSKLEKIS